MRRFMVWAMAVGILILSTAANAADVAASLLYSPTGGAPPTFAVGKKAAVQKTIILFTDGAENVVSIQSPASGGAVVVTLTGSNFRTIPVGPAVTDGEHVVFRGVDPAGPAGPNNGVFSLPLSGGIPITIYGSDYASPIGAPSISRGGGGGGSGGIVGKVVFQDISVTDGSTQILTATTTGGVIGTLPIDWRNGSKVSQPAINNAGDVAFSTTGPDGVTRSLYVVPASGGVIGTIPGLPAMKLTSGQPTIIDNDKRSVFFSAIAEGPTEAPFAVYRSDVVDVPGAPPAYGTPVPLFTADDASPLPYSVNASGDVVFKKGYDCYLALANEQTGVAGGPETTFAVLFTAGQSTVNGLTITDFQLSPSSLLDNGEAVVHLTLSDGSNGFYSIAVPEPASAAVLAMAGAALLGRGNRVRA